MYNIYHLFIIYVVFTILYRSVYINTAVRGAVLAQHTLTQMLQTHMRTYKHKYIYIYIYIYTYIYIFV